MDGTTSPDRARALPEREGHHDDAEVERRLREELAPDLEIVRRLGRDTFGDLYLARQRSVPRDVVVKVLRADYATDSEARLRFARGAAAAGNLRHPHVVEVFSSGTLSTGVPYLVQPYLGECTLAARLRALGRFDAPRVATILSDLASALDTAHEMGIVHRDVRPETILCQDTSDRVLLTDFELAAVLESTGLAAARTTWSGKILASLGTLSPEQQEERPVTDRTDVYGLGALGWRLLVGPDTRLPWEEVRSRRYWRSLGEEVGDTNLTDLIRRCLAEDPADRPRAADVVERVAGSENRGASATGPVPWGVLGVLGVAATVLGVAADWGDVAPRLLGLILASTVAGVAAIVVGFRYHGAKGRQEFQRVELWLYGAIGAAWLLASVAIWSLGPD